MSTALEIHIGRTAQGAYITFTVTAVKIKNGKEIPYHDFGTVAQDQLLNSFKARARNIVAFMEGESCERLTIFNGSALTSECKKPYLTGKIPNEPFFEFYQELSLISPK